MTLRYPVADPAEWRGYGALSLAGRAALAIRERRYRRRAPRREGIELTPVAPVAPVDPGEIVLLCTLRDAEATVPSFLRHYRAMGVRRFAAVDDGSVDATRQLLEAAGDVDVFTSNVGFREAGGGLVWRDMLMARYGRGRWYLSIDSDEYLVFPGCETRPLAAFVADLERTGLRRAMAPMLDLYPDGPIGAAEAPADPSAAPTDVAPLFDGSGYSVGLEKFCVSVRGGPRNRLFGTVMRMTKFPLVFADRHLAFAGGSHHGPLPLRRNFTPAHAVLLHHKFAPGSVETFRTIAERGSHFGGSAFYRQIVADAQFGPATDFRYDGSVRFAGSEPLVAAGFMQDLRG